MLAVHEPLPFSHPCPHSSRGPCILSRTLLILSAAPESHNLDQEVSRSYPIEPHRDKTANVRFCDRISINQFHGNGNGSGSNAPGADHKGQHLHPRYVGHAALLRNVDFARFPGAYIARWDLQPDVRPNSPNGLAGYSGAGFQHGRAGRRAMCPSIRRQCTTLFLHIVRPWTSTNIHICPQCIRGSYPVTRRSTGRRTAERWRRIIRHPGLWVLPFPAGKATNADV